MVSKIKEIKTKEELQHFLSLAFEIDPTCLRYVYDSDDNEFVALANKFKVSSTIDLKSFVNEYFQNYNESGGQQGSIEYYKYELVSGFFIEFYINYIDREIKVLITKKC